MRSIKKKFENETKTRINIIGSDNSVKNLFKRMLVKKGIFDKVDFHNDDSFYIFPTEILCSSTKNQSIRVYLIIKKKEYIISELKENILKSIYEANIMSKNTADNEENIIKRFKEDYIAALNKFYKLSLNKFYGTESIKSLFESVNFEKLLIELKRIDYVDNQEVLDGKDEFIWGKYFNEFQINFQKQYEEWEKKIIKYYTVDEEGHEYINEDENYINKYSNEYFYNLCKTLYGLKSSCSLMIERAYIEVPSSKEQFSGNIYIYYAKDNQYRSISQIIENRISEDYKELFIILAKCNEDMDYYSRFKENINKVTLNKRIFFILDSYINKSLNKENRISANIKNKIIDSIKLDVSKKIGISEEKIIITEYFKDIDKNTLKVLERNNDFLHLLTKIKEESEEIGKAIKIKPLSKEKIINISLNQERMSVQALVTMLYERYNGYLVDLWNRIIEGGETNSEQQKYYYSEIRTIIRNRKDDYKEYKHISYENANKENGNIIDFSLRNGDYNDSKKILKMLVNYGCNTVGFNSNESKIIISVNGEISKEDKEKLVKSIKGRLEESAINYFESAFLVDVSKNKFNHNSLYKALESEKNITIDDFYNAFKEIFRKMSENILRYEVSLQ